MISIIILLFIGILLFNYFKNLIMKFDEEHGIIKNKYDNVITTLFSIINSVIIYNFTQNNLIRFVLIISFSVLLVCAYTDLKTNFVYRVYSYLLIMVNLIYLVINKNNIPDLESILTLVFFIIIINVLTIKNCFGKGDSYILIANSLLVITLNQNYYFPIEVILWHFVLSAVLMIILNLKQMNFKTLRFNKPIPFVPYIYLATLIMILLYIRK